MHPGKVPGQKFAERQKDHKKPAGATRRARVGERSCTQDEDGVYL